jgi:hypothetical protein
MQAIIQSKQGPSPVRAARARARCPPLERPAHLRAQLDFVYAGSATLVGNPWVLIHDVPFADKLLSSLAVVFEERLRAGPAVTPAAESAPAPDTAEPPAPAAAAAAAAADAVAAAAPAPAPAQPASAPPGAASAATVAVPPPAQATDSVPPTAPAAPAEPVVPPAEKLAAIVQRLKDVSAFVVSQPVIAIVAFASRPPRPSPDPHDVDERAGGRPGGRA